MSTEPRIVSLIASATEIVAALGALDRLVGRSHECDFPPQVTAIPPLTSPKFRVDAPGREVDRAVKALVEQGLAVYAVDAERLRSLRPDVILTQDQCEVCAVSLKDVEAAVCGWASGDVRVVSMRPCSLADVRADIVRVGESIGCAAEAAVLLARMDERIAAVSARVAGAPRPRVAFVEWIDPLMTGGHWLPELVEAAGGSNVIGEAGKPSPWISLADISARDPDVIIVAPCGYDIATTRREMKVLDSDPDWRRLRAVGAGRVFLADGNAYFNRPGPRLVETIEILAEALHPGLAGFGHMGRTVVSHGG